MNDLESELQNIENEIELMEPEAVDGGGNPAPKRALVLDTNDPGQKRIQQQRMSRSLRREVPRDPIDAAIIQLFVEAAGTLSQAVS
eukprot:4752484-Amphidinium_carterae.2